jgi:tetratricopeptide (TPR) repeat protein
MHQLLQKAVRAEVGQAHDDVMAALLEARCGCMGDEGEVDHRMYGVMREVVGAAGHVVGRMKAAAAQRAAWVCSMRVRVLQLARAVIGDQSLEIVAYRDALDADLCALGVKRGGRVAAEYRAMQWWRESFSGDERSYQALIREVEEALGSAPDAAAGWDCRAALGKAQHAAGSFMGDRGQEDRAIELYERALRIKEATLGEMHADTAATIRSMGTAYGEKGQEDRAIELFERALRIEEATLGEMHAQTAGTILSMGTAYGKKGQYDRAIELYERALRIQEATLGEMHAETAATIMSMGASYSYKGQEDRAIELYERALRIQEATLGEMHAQTAGTISSMGASYNNKGQYDRAIELYERALRIQEATLGEMHAETAGTISSMGASYSKKGQHDRAIAATERALRICRQVLDPHHPQTLQTQQSLANIRSAAARAGSGRGRR